jgi:hypothetical protein
MEHPLRILVLGASYGLLPGIKLALAGHRVSFVGRDEEVAAMAQAPLELLIPLRRTDDVVRLRTDRAALTTPAAADPQQFDFALLAMQEPHFAAPDVAALMGRIAAAGVPCLSIMNLPPPCFLARIGTFPAEVLAGVYSSAAVWAAMDPQRFTLASPDAQAVRKDPARPGQLTVTLPSNFKAAPFARPEDQALLDRLANDMSRLKCMHEGELVRPPVMLRATASVFAPLAKWPMLVAGNCRCLIADGTRSIDQAVNGDRQETQAIYEQVAALARRLGAGESDLVDFDSYAKAAEQLSFPSSLARGLAAGARQVERIDRLVLNLMRHEDMETAAIEAISAAIDRRLEANLRS